MAVLPIEKEQTDTYDELLRKAGAMTGGETFEDEQRKIRQQLDLELAENPMPAQEMVKSLKAGEPPEDLWTLDDMEKGKPLTCLYMNNPNRKFLARPEMHTPFVQKRLALIEEYNKAPGKKVTYTRLMTAISEVVHRLVIKMTTYEVEEDEDGNPVLDEQGEPVMVEVPVHEAIDKMRFNQLIEIINAVTKAMQGEVNG